ncbi:MAG: methylmalonyl-CoA epimerase [Chloroflexi bacterium]|nr:methylmalonyl-CoA epimerase [Chloroflexota bacterium]
MIKGVRRVSVAVRSLASALLFYRDALGFSVTRHLDLPERGLRLVRLDAFGTDIELMEPTDPTGNVALFLEQRGEGLHHVALEVEDIELEIRTLLARGVELIDRVPRDGPDGRIAFVHPRSTGGVLVQLSEPKAVMEGKGAT